MSLTGRSVMASTSPWGGFSSGSSPGGPTKYNASSKKAGCYIFVVTQGI